MDSSIPIYIAGPGIIMAALPPNLQLPPLPPPLQQDMADFFDVVGFHDPDERFRLIEAGLASCEDFRYLVEKDVRDMAEEFSKRAVANGRIIFGIGRIKRLSGLMHWVQDCFRTNTDPHNVVFDEDALNEALSRALVRKADIDLVDTNSKAADPGKFKDERKWNEWSKAFMNYLSVIPGVNGVPLSYVIREVEHPDIGARYLTFTDRMIACAPLTGQYFQADSRRVHTLLTGFLQGELTENWIRPLAPYQDGRRDMIALRNHYAGEGNSTRRISDANRIRSSLHYKSERSLPFGKFMDSLQRMFTIFEEEGEPLTERAKVDELLTKVQHPGLTAAIAHLRYQLNTTGVTFTIAANHLNSTISQTPDYQMARRINSTTSSNRGGRSGGRDGKNGGRGGRNGRYSGRGRGHNKPTPNASGFYATADWNKLSFEERDKIRKERDKKGQPGGTKRTVSEVSVEQANAIIGAIQKVQSIQPSVDTQVAHPTAQAGNAFGGRANIKKLRTTE